MEVVARFNKEDPQILLEDGSLVQAEVGTEDQQFRVAIGGKIYDHCSDMVVEDEDGNAYKRWAYRRQER